MSDRAEIERLAMKVGGLISRFKTPSHERGVLNGAVEELRRLSAARDSLRAVNAELMEALIGLDEAYCRAGQDLTWDERFEDRKRLIAARASIASARKQENHHG